MCLAMAEVHMAETVETVVVVMEEAVMVAENKISER